MLHFSSGMLGGSGHSSWLDTENLPSEGKFLLDYIPGLQGYTHSFPCRLDADFTGVTKAATPQIRSLQNYLSYRRDHISNHVQAKDCLLENWWSWPFKSLFCSCPVTISTLSQIARLTDLHLGSQGPVFRAPLCCNFRGFQDLNLCLCTMFCTHVLVPVHISSQFADL